MQRRPSSARRSAVARAVSTSARSAGRYERGPRPWIVPFTAGEMIECARQASRAAMLRHVHLEHRERHGLDRVVQRHAVLRQPGRVDQRALRRCRCCSCRKSISAPSWFDWTISSSTPSSRGQRCQPLVDLRQRGRAVDVRLAPAEQVEVRAVQDEDLHGASDSLADAREFVVVELDDGRVVGGGELVGHRLGDLRACAPARPAPPRCTACPWPAARPPPSAPRRG